MCCFSKPTEVHQTRIFARRTGPHTQTLVYQMTYSATEPTAMILPLPVTLPASESSVRWKSLKEYSQLFSDLELGYPEISHGFSLFRSKSAVSVAAAPDAQLAVHEVGDYIASFVPTVEDFSRVDPRFSISKEVWSKIPEYKDYGFAVFQLANLSGSTHPIAFDFDTRHDSIFFPTVHIHDGSVHEKDEFDHVLYLQDASLDGRVSSYGGPQKIDGSTNLVRSQKVASSFVDGARALGIVAGDQLVHKTTLTGLLPNKDTFYDLRAKSSGCTRCDASGEPMLMDSHVPGLAAIAGLAWIIRRRNTVR